jgi:hypothetical protein
VEKLPVRYYFVGVLLCLGCLMGRDLREHVYKQLKRNMSLSDISCAKRQMLFFGAPDLTFCLR